MVEGFYLFIVCYLICRVQTDEPEIPLLRWVENTISSSGSDIRILYPITPGDPYKETDLGLSKRLL